MRLIDKLFSKLSIKTIIYLGLVSMAISVVVISSLFIYVNSNMQKTKTTISDIIEIEEQTKSIFKKLNSISDVEMKIVLAKHLEELDLIDEVELDDFTSINSIYLGSNIKLKKYKSTLEKMKELLLEQIDIKEQMSEISYSIISYDKGLLETIFLIEDEIKEISNLTELISGKVKLYNKRRNRKLSKEISLNDERLNSLVPDIIEALIGSNDKIDQNVNALQDSVSNLTVLAREINLAANKDILNDLRTNKLIQSRNLLEKKLTTLINTLEKKELKEIVLKMTSHIIRIAELQDSLVNLKQFSFLQKENFDELMLKRKKVNSNIISNTNILSSIVKDINFQIVNSFEKTASNTKNFIFIIIVIVAFFLLSFGWILISRVNKPLARITKSIEGISPEKNNLHENIEVEFDDELKKLVDAFNKMTSSLFNNIQQLQKREEEISLLNKELEKRVEQRTKELSLKTQKIQDLFHNAKQGFLSFNRDLQIDEEYSLECEKLLGEDIAKKDVSDLFFDESNNKKEFFRNTLIDIFNEENEIVQNSFIDLLPKEFIINRRAISLEYKKLSSDKFMLILTNITSKKKLEKKIKQEQQLLKMIVTIISDSEQFYEILNDFKEFNDSKLKIFNLNNSAFFNLSETYREIHTFKGMFSQLFMSKTVKKLHDFETQISEYIKDKNLSNKDLEQVLKDIDMFSWIDEDLEVIKSILGENFINNESIIKVNEEMVIKLEDKIKDYCRIDKVHSENYEDILFDAQKLRSKTIYQALQMYPKLSLELAQKLGKQLNDFDIIGDKSIILPPNFKAFIKSLIHVFRNLVDHGIEDVDTRIELGKNEAGTIISTFRIDGDSLVIMISDDGKGINREKIKEKVLEENLLSLEEFDKMSDERVFGLIFYESFSTREKVSEVSGRGIGMSVIKNELVKIKGSVEVKSIINEGTTFIFKLPYKRKGVRDE